MSTDEIARCREALDTAVASFDAAAVRECSERLAACMEAHLVEHPPGFRAALARSLDTFDKERTASLCHDLVAHLRGRTAPYPPDHAAGILGLLRRKRRFHDILDVADALIQQGCDSARIRRLYAQALIDAGHLTAGIDTLRQLEARCLDGGDEEELAEARGLLGRAWKQIYCGGAGDDARRRQTLETAERCYAEPFRRDNRLLWHGINSVALQCRARRDGLTGFVPATGPIAGHDILALAGTAGPHRSDADVWTCATLAEAALAEGDIPQALGWVKHYVERDDCGTAPADAFEIAGTLRQFEELWQLDVGDPGHARILEVLRSALLDREGGSVRLDDVRAESDAIDTLLEDDAFEQILGPDRFKNLRWYREGLERARSVCKFVDRYGDGFGSGFLLPAEALGLAHDARWVVLTNAHVVSESPEEQGGSPAAVPPHAAAVRFEASEKPERDYAITRVLATSPRRELDFSVLAFDGEGDFPEPLELARSLPLVGRHQRIYVIGHPRGGSLSFSLNDNLLLDHEAPRIHYRSPTEGGSSGSPLFNQVWQLIGLHHAGGTEMPRLNGQGGRYEANEGLWIESIREAITSGAVR